MNYIFADTETGGFSPTTNSLLTIGMVAADENLREIGSLYIKVKHSTYNCTPKAMEVNGINLREHHKDPESVTLLTANQLIRSFLAKYEMYPTLVGHNISFDIKFLQSQVSPHFMNPFSVNPICTKQMVDKARKEGRMPGLSSSKLEEVARSLGISYNAHNALDDARMSLEVFRRL